MAGTILIFEDDASHAKACAEYLAKLAKKWAAQDPKEGDEQDVQNNLEDILKVLRGEPL